MINNAAAARYGPLEDFSPAEIQLEVATKLLGSLFMARRGIQGMRAASSGGDILFVTSLAAASAWPCDFGTREMAWCRPTSCGSVAVSCDTRVS